MALEKLCFSDVFRGYKKRPYEVSYSVRATQKISDRIMIGSMERNNLDGFVNKR